MKILLLTHRVPYPLHDGGAIGVDYFITGYLSQNVELSVLSLNTSKHFVDVDSLPAYYKNLKLFKTVNIETDLKPLQALKYLLTNKSYHAARFYSKEFEDKLVEILKENEFDLVQFDNIYLGHYVSTVRQFSKSKITCRIHNIEHEIWKKLSLNEKNFLKKIYLKILANQLEQFEISTLKKMDLLLIIAKEDELFLQNMKVNIPTYYLPFGIEINTNDSLEINNSKTCFHIGSMNWLPNIEGINWFLNNVWQYVLDKNKTIICNLAGKEIDKVELPKKKNVEIHFPVHNANEFIQSYNVLVVPLLSGDGIRVKIIEALALGKKVVSTTIGLRGIDGEHMKDFYIADTPQDFANCIIQAIESNNTMNENAIEFVQKKYNKISIFKHTLSYFSTLK